MKATYTPDRLTPFSFAEAAEAMRAALDNVKDQSILALALAKTALETGRWTKIHCFNWGNAKAGENYGGMYTTFWCDEILNGKRVVFYPDGEAGKRGTWEVPPGHPQTRFRAYANRFDGAYEYVKLLQKRFPASYQAMLTGHAPSFVHALKSERYFTADVNTYTKGVSSLQNEILKKLMGLPRGPELQDQEFETLAALTVGHRFDLLDLDGDGFVDRDRETDPSELADTIPPPPEVA